jgi:hypothetical protein
MAIGIPSVGFSRISEPEKSSRSGKEGTRKKGCSSAAPTVAVGGSRPENPCAHRSSANQLAEMTIVLLLLTACEASRWQRAANQSRPLVFFLWKGDHQGEPLSLLGFDSGAE